MTDKVKKPAIKSVLAEDKPTKARWVMASYNPKSEEGKRVVAQASMGIGYYILNTTRTGSEDVVVGFLRAEDSALPPHMEYCLPHNEAKLDEMRSRRLGAERIKTI